MKLVLFLIFTGYAVNCDDESNNYYVIERPDQSRIQKQMQVYWNVPTFQCRSKKVLFQGLLQKYGVKQNQGDNFRGDQLAILYDPGLFPAITKSKASGEIIFRNGGVPQEGDLNEHLLAFNQVVEEQIPDKEFSGVGIIDFESWRPIFRQNFGSLTPYINASLIIERKLHPWWTKDMIKAEAKRRFEKAGRMFMQETLIRAKTLRPRAVWGYYAFPYCFNTKDDVCSNAIKKENDQLYWLWSESQILFPSVYSSKELSTDQLTALIRGRVTESARVAKRGTPILSYFSLLYRENEFMKKVDLNAALKAIYGSSASGAIIWGSSNDVNTREKCMALLDYVENVFGPAVSKYTQSTFKYLNDSESNDTINKDSLSTENPFNILTDLINVKNISRIELNTTKDTQPNDNESDGSIENDSIGDRNVFDYSDYNFNLSIIAPTKSNDSDKFDVSTNVTTKKYNIEQTTVTNKLSDEIHAINISNIDFNSTKDIEPFDYEINDFESIANNADDGDENDSNIFKDCDDSTLSTLQTTETIKHTDEKKIDDHIDVTTTKYENTEQTDIVSNTTKGTKVIDYEIDDFELELNNTDDYNSDSTLSTMLHTTETTKYTDSKKEHENEDAKFKTTTDTVFSDEVTTEINIELIRYILLGKKKNVDSVEVTTESVLFSTNDIVRTSEKLNDTSLSVRSSNNQVSGASVFGAERRFLICIIFFFSVSKCMCGVYGRCS